MGEKGSDTDRGSGLTESEIDAALTALLQNPQVVECLRARRDGQPAELGLFVGSRNDAFYQPPDSPARAKPSVDGFAPLVILVGKGSATKTLTAFDADAYQSSTAGLMAPGVVDLATRPDPIAFLRALLRRYGMVQIAPRMSPDLARSVPFIRADGATQTAELDNVDLPATTNPLEPAKTVAPPFDGSGTTICIVDMGCDFAHRNFRIPADATTDQDLLGSRIQYLIDIKTTAPDTVTANVHDRAKIESWLKPPSGTVYPAANNPYDAAKADPKPYDPHAPNRNCTPPGPDGTHGTLVMDIAAGNGNGTGVPGVAPKADLVFVQVKVSSTAGAKYVSAASVYEAINFAEPYLNGLGKPFVVNVSLGTNEGPHDFNDHGTSSAGLRYWNNLLDDLFDRTKKGRALVWSAGNQAGANSHAFGRVKANAPATFDIRIQKGDQRPNVITLWYEKRSTQTFSVQYRLQDYKGAPSTYAPAWQSAGSGLALPVNLVDDTGRDAGSGAALVKYGVSPASYLHYVTTTIKPPSMRNPHDVTDNDRWEIWRIELSVTDPMADIPVNAWIERDDGDQAQFTQPVMTTGNANSTIELQGTLSAGAAGVGNAIVVGAIGTATYFPGSPIDSPGVGQIMPFSSAGPNRTGDKRPHLCAPGEVVSGAKSKGDPVALGTGFGNAEFTAMSGTSMAAPHVAGVISLLYDKARQLRIAPANLATSAEMRQLLISSARPNKPNGPRVWDPQRGYGCVDAVEALSRILPP